MEFEDPYAQPTHNPKEVRRDGKGRPYIKEANLLGELTGREVTYTRVTTYIKCVDDASALTRWGERQLVMGLLGPRGQRFRTEASSLLEEPRLLDKLIWRVKEAAGAGDRAAIGTAVHAITERHDRGLDIGYVDDLCVGDLEAYIDATRYLRHEIIETMVVNDELRTAGTPDRVTKYKPCEICGKSYYIFDLKTGRVDSYTQNSQAMQLAVYAHSRMYDPETGQRTDLPDVCLHRGIICALPAGTAQADLLWTDIDMGWKLVKVATAVRKARRVKAATEPFIASPVGS